MLKDTLVDLILDDATSAVQKVYDISYMEHLPVGISAKHSLVLRRAKEEGTQIFLWDRKTGIQRTSHRLPC